VSEPLPETNHRIPATIRDGILVVDPDLTMRLCLTSVGLMRTRGIFDDTPKGRPHLPWFRAMLASDGMLCVG
jgi:hypothetical protein